MTVAGISFIGLSIGSFLALLFLNFLGTGFGYGDLKKDLLRIAGVATIVACVEGGWSFAPARHWTFAIITTVIHAIVFKLFFMEELETTEAVMAAVICRGVLIIAGMILVLSTA